MTYERKNIRAMQGYSSGEQPQNGDTIKLNTNENPFPPGPGVTAALKALSADSLRRYPPPTATTLRTSIARLHGLEPEQVMVTNGGDELLRLVITTFVEPATDAIAVAAPTYTLYEVLAGIHDCRFISFDLQEDWQLPPDFAGQMNAAGARLCLLPNPHAPSGTLLPASTIRALAESFKGVLVLDEAYADFVDPESDYNCTGLVREFDNLLILRTFSKGYSLAGLRMAYGLGQESLIAPMQYKTKDSYNTDFISQQLAQAAIEDQNYASMTWRVVREQRALLRKTLAAMNFSSPPSQSNFLLVDVPTPLSAESIYLALKARGILVRYFKQDRLHDKLRISIGSESENRQLINALQDIISKGNT